MSLLVAGEQVEVEGLEIVNIPLPRGLYRKRKLPKVRSVCLHTRMGIHPQILVSPPETKDNDWHLFYPKRCEESKKRTGRVASAHLTVGPSGKIGCHADLSLHATYHATTVNEVSVGIEMYQDADGKIYRATIDATVELVGAICAALNIPRQLVKNRGIDVRFAASDRLHPRARWEYMEGGQRGEKFYGVFGHRNVTRNRGQGDPGDTIFDALLAAGFEDISI